MKFVILSDTHFVPVGQTLFALDPRARLDAAIQAINRDHSDLEFVIITGDLAHSGQSEAYRNLANALERITVPVLLMLGNHDRRAPFRKTFADADDDGNGFVQSMRVFEGATVVTLDTLDEGARSHAGFLCDRRLGFLERSLAEAPADRPLLLFQHHPPFDNGLPHMDRIKLRNPDAFWGAIARTRKPDYLFIGHVHRPIAGHWRRIPFHCQRAVCHQVGFNFESSVDIPVTHEAPDYSLVTVGCDHIVIHQRSFLYSGPVYWHDAEAVQAAMNVDA
jgi:3',5'-cyclic AMP phosphodiesterase CpdA